MRGFALVALLALGGACSELPAVQSGVCGNGILEAGEDCDRPGDGCVECGITCIADPDDADRRICKDPGFACGVDDFCHAASGVFDTKARSELPFPSLGFRVSDVDFDGYGDVVGLNATALNLRYGDSTGTLPDSYNVATPQLRGFPAVAHLASSHVADVILPTADGLVAYTGAFGVPSPRQFPLGGGADVTDNRPTPYDAVDVASTVALFGPGTSNKLTFGVMSVTSFGPYFEAEISNLCGQEAQASMQQWEQHAASTFSTGGYTFVVFTYANTCVLRVRKMPAATPIARGDARCPLLEGIPMAQQQPCAYEVVSVTDATFPTLTKPPVLADLDGDGCPSVISQDGGLPGIQEYAGTGGPASCTIAATPTKSLPIDDVGRLIGTVPLVPAIPQLSHDALVTSRGIYAFDSTDTPVRLYASDRPMERVSVGDLDDDGAIDVVLTTSLPNFDIAHRVQSANAFLLVRTPTVGAVTQTVVADFDGDERDDLAYVEDLGAANRLSIAYGTGAGLAPGIQADAFTRVEYMSAMQVTDSTDPMGIVDDLMVIDLTMPGSNIIVPELTILHGSPSRTMLSFYGPPVPEAGTAFSAVEAGDFVDGDVGTGIPRPTTTGFDDLVAFQTGLTGTSDEAETAVWLIPGLANARLGRALFADPVTGPPRTTAISTCVTGFTDFCLQFSVFATFHSVVSSDPAIDHDVILAVDYQGPDEGAHLLRLDPAEITATTALPAGSITTGVFEKGGKIFDLEVIDIEHDGLPELVASFSTSSQNTSPFRPDGHVEICPLTSEGRIAGRCVDVADEVLGQPGLECVDGVAGDGQPLCDATEPGLVVLCRAYTPADADPRNDTDVIESYVVTVTGSGGAYAASLKDAILDVKRRLDVLQLADVTGDGVGDLVTLDSSSGIASLQVYTQHSSREEPVCVAQ